MKFNGCDLFSGPITSHMNFTFIQAEEEINYSIKFFHGTFKAVFFSTLEP